ncbi:exonuclease domain-containing protein [Alteromonas sp. A081]|uniref:3'-5' exonuclease n=1 Tax=Alteromonas sp. A081 TaxID=3410269 RepID=UPI003B98044C
MQNKWLPSIIDVEASGFGAASYPIEVGIVRYDGAKWCKLIRPFDSWIHWDDKAEQLHGISREMLHTRGIEPVRVCQELNHFLGNTIVYSDGWVVDNPWMIKLFSAAQVEMAFTCRAMEYILSEAQMNMWHEVKDDLSVNLDTQRHRASADAFLIQQTFIQTQIKASKKANQSPKQIK